MAEPRPLSAGQQAMWLLYRLAPDSSAYNVVLAARIRGGLDPGRLLRAVHATAQRHEMIRSEFTEADGEPRRLVRGPETVRLDVHEVDQPELLGAPIAAVCHRPFRLAAGEPPARVALFRHASGDAVLALVVHHIATDAASQWMLFADLLDAYQEPGVAQPQAGRYDSYVEQERRFLASPERARLAGLWRDACAGAVAAELPPDRPRPDRPASGGATYQLPLGTELASQVRAAAASAGVTPFGFLLGVFTALLGRLTGQSDLTVGCLATTRRGRAMRDVVGYLVNPVPVRVRSAGSGTFAEAARLAHTAVVTGMRYAHYPFPALVSDLNLPRLPGRTPMFQITFGLIEASPRMPLSQALPIGSALGPEIEYAGLRLAQLDIPQMEGQFDVSVEVRQRGEAIAVVFRYATGLFTAGTIELLARRYARLITIAAGDPDTPIVNSSLVGNSELRQLLSFGVGSK